MLTPEERQRIEEEELKRLAEEQYRAEVRAKLQQAAAPAQSSRTWPWMLGIGAVMVAIVVFAIAAASSSNQAKNNDEAAGSGRARSAVASAPVPKIRYVPVNQKLATGQVIVKAGQHIRYRFRITPEMVAPFVTGSFSASGGSGNDIAAVIADEMNYTNWINGHAAKVYWSTEGKKTTDRFELRLPPGEYYLVFSNQFSTFTDKQVFLEVDLNYKRAETYY